MRLAGIIGLGSVALFAGGLLVWLLATSVTGRDPFEVYDNESDDE